jgi:hypothetical protein
VSSRRPKEPLPPALPPAERTVGQLVAETIRFYGSHFWPSLALGIGPAALTIAAAPLGRDARLAVIVPGGALAFAISYAGASVLVSQQRPVPQRSLLVAFAAGVLAYVPLPILSLAFILPAFAWLAFVGLAVPVAVIEGLGLRASFGRAVRLARADYVHALGSLATLAIVTFLSQAVLFLVLRGAGEAALRVAAFLAQLVVTPVLFLGAALLYFDQAARELGSRPLTLKRRRRGHADVPTDDDADRPGRPDTKGKPRPATRGKQ